MKKYILLALAILITGCSSSYHKDIAIRINYHTGEPEYTIWIYKKYSGSDYMMLHLPISQMTENTMDSINRVADSMIIKLEELQKEINNRK